MTEHRFHEIYLNRLSAWKGYKINELEDFDMICECQVDFIEILLIGENEFSINLLENNRSLEDFSSVKNYLDWAFSNPDYKTEFKYEINFYHPVLIFSDANHYPCGNMVA